MLRKSLDPPSKPPFSGPIATSHSVWAPTSWPLSSTSLSCWGPAQPKLVPLMKVAWHFCGELTYPAAPVPEPPLCSYQNLLPPSSVLIV